MRLVLHFRRPSADGAFSIERVFAPLSEEFSRHYEVRSNVVPVCGARPLDVARNIASCIGMAADIHHITGDVSYLALGLPKQSTVITIHDCVTLRRKRGISRYLLRKIWYEWAAAGTGAVTAVSEFSKQEICSITGIAPGRVVVVPNPVHGTFRWLDARDWPSVPRVLFLGTSQNKNLERTAVALEGLRMELRVIGRLQREQESLLRKHRVVFSAVDGLTDESLRAEYEACQFVLFPSYYEGFGLPIIEANACGRPVITSNVCSMPEVASDAAEYVDPNSVMSIRAAVERLLVDADRRAELVARGMRNASRFRADVIARRYMEIYAGLPQLGRCGK